MPSPLPTPLAAALGIVPTVLLGVRRLPGKAFSLPVQAITTTLNTLDTVRREYDLLAQRGDQLAQRLLGGAGELVDDVSEQADAVEDRVTELASRTSVSAAYDKVENALEDASRTIGRRAGSTLHAVADQADQVVDAGGTAALAAVDALTPVDLPTTAGSASGQSATAGGVGLAERPKGAPTPKATEPDTTRRDTAASPDVVHAVEQVAAATVSAVPEHDELALPDYDHMTLGSLRGRLRSLSLEHLTQLRAYEKAHADRLPVVTMLDNRIAKLASDPSAQPSGPVSLEPAPEQRTSVGTGATVSPATTDAPKINPPSQGVPTNPAQPR